MLTEWCLAQQTAQTAAIWAQHAQLDYKLIEENTNKFSQPKFVKRPYQCAAWTP